MHRAHAGCCRAPPQTTTGSFQSPGHISAAAEGLPNQAPLGTAGRSHQPSSSAHAVGMPPGLRSPPQQGGVAAARGPQQAAATDQQSTQVLSGRMQIMHSCTCMLNWTTWAQHEVECAVQISKLTVLADHTQELAD